MLRLALTSIVLVALSLLAPVDSQAEDAAPLTAKIVSLEKIWEAAPHNAYWNLSS